jgi:hypothetical protein
VKFFASESAAQTEQPPKICDGRASVGSITTSM